MWCKSGKLKTYQAFNVFISSPIYVCLPSSCLFISFPILSRTPQKRSCIICSTMSSLTSQKAITIFSHCTQNSLTHHRTPLGLKMSRERRGVRKSSEGAGKSCTRSKFSYCSGAFLLSLYFVVLLFPPGHFPSSPVKAKRRSNKECGTLSLSHYVDSTFPHRKVFTLFNCRSQIYAHPADSVASTSQITQLDAQCCKQH